MSVRSALLAVMVLASCTGAGPRVAAAPRIASAPPSADADVALSDGRTLHVRALPLGRLDGIVLDGARFDASGTRIVLLATFANGAVGGDWHRAGPTQAYELDIGRRMLTALTNDGSARGVAWADATHVRVRDGASTALTAVSPATRLGPRMPLSAVTPFTIGDLVSPAAEFRLQVLKRADGSYAVGQVGAVRLRAIAVSQRTGTALVGSSIAWVDTSRNGGPPIARSGPDDVLPMSFAGTPYGDALTHVLPLGHLAYQGAYRNGVAYLAFTIGLQRIVAATTDFVNYTYPALPAQPDFTIGDGLGAGADGILYFADPENRVVQTWRDGRYVERTMTFPDGVSDVRRLDGVMSRLAADSKLEPPMRPDADALDEALLEWRIYPVGDVTGERWIASYLGEPYVASADLHFRVATPPRFPFAVLGRTDDGRLWGASPLGRTDFLNAVDGASELYSSRDGLHWTAVARVPGGAGAVGLHDGTVWIALSADEFGEPGVEVLKIASDASDAAGAEPTGALYAGEDMFFAELGQDLYLVCGGEPGTRDDDGSGPLVALHLDADRLFTAANAPAATAGARSVNEYLADRIEPLRSSLSDGSPSPFDVPSLSALRSPGYSMTTAATIVTDTPVLASCCRVMTPDSEREFELEYAWKPFPLARVDVRRSGDTAIVTRTFERGPLSFDGAVERWSKNASGEWRLLNVIHRWHV